MNLPKASDSFTVARPAFNPLWRHIYRAFQDQLLATVDSDHYDDCLYVERRTADDGITEDDVVRYVRESNRQPLLIYGPAGVGKTTFLRHTCRSKLDANEYVLAWVNVLREYDPVAGAPIAEQVRTLIAKKIGNVVQELEPDRKMWWRFLLERTDDGSGAAEIVLAELEKSAPSSSEAPTMLVQMLVDAKRRPLEYLRTFFAFVRVALRRIPCVVIDNVDQLPVDRLEELVQDVSLLSSSAQSPGTQSDGYASVILALRPITQGKVAEKTHFVLRGQLRPPVMGEVISLRLTRFFEAYKGRVARGTVLSDEYGRQQVELRKVFEDDEVALTESPDKLVERAIRAVTLALTQESFHHNREILNLVQDLTNHNTRLSLLATAQYVASGHLPWRELLGVLAGDRTIDQVLTPRKTLMALILGVRPIYDTRTSWLCNVFHDSARDRISACVRFRVLRAAAAAQETQGVVPHELAHAFDSLFGYLPDRTIGTCRNLHELGLLEERKSGSLMLTPGGELYLARMVTDFEYLQHVLVDSCVGREQLVPCTTPDEPASKRFLRVLRYGQWMAQIEIEELAHAISNRRDDIYRRHFGEDLVCASIDATLRNVFVRLPRHDADKTVWDGLNRELERLHQTVQFRNVEAEARRLAGRELTALAEAVTAPIAE